MGGLGGGIELFGAGRRGAWRRRVARRGLSAALAGVAVLGCVAVARTPEGGPRSTVVVAVRDLPAGHRLGPADLVAQDRPSGFAPTRPLRGLAEAAGRRLAGPLTAGEVLTAGRLVGPGLLDGRSDEVRAVHVAVADPGAMSMVRPGDTVDLVAATGRMVAAAVTVLAVSGGSDPGAGGLSGLAAGGGGLVAAVTAEQARTLASAPPDDLGGSAVTVVLRGGSSLR